MGLGSTAKKLQRLGDVAEELYKRVAKMREEIDGLRSTVEGTETDAARLRREVAEQRAILEALAEREGIDTSEIVRSAEIPEPAGDPTPSSATEADDSTPPEAEASDD